MANGICPDEGLARRLVRILDNEDTAFMGWSVLIFVNDVNPGAGATLATFVEPSWGGYARFTLDPALWSAPVVADSEATSTYGTGPLEWVNAAGATETVFGYALYDPLFGQVVLAQRFEDGDIHAIAAGESSRVQPVFAYRSQTASE